MPHELFEITVFAIAFIAPLVLGFGASELFKGMAYGGSAAFLGVLVLALLFDGWQDAGNAALQKIFFNSMSVVPVATLLALVGFMIRRLLGFVRDDQRAAG